MRRHKGGGGASKFKKELKIENLTEGGAIKEGAAIKEGGGFKIKKRIKK
jgi:hypothetical protein